MNSRLAESLSAVLLGAWSWPNHSDLEPRSAFARSARGICQYFKDSPDIGVENVLDLFDSPSNPKEQLEDVAQFVRYKSDSGRDCLVVYYVGHGVIARDQFLLTPRCTSEALLTPSSLPWVGLIEAVRHAAAGIKLVGIIDSCFSGAAGNLDDYGTVSILSSTNDSDGVVAPEQAEYTPFSGALLSVLNDGTVEDNDHFSLRSLRDAISRTLSRSRESCGADWDQSLIPKPTVYSPGVRDLDLADVGLFRNPLPGSGLITARSRVFEGDSPLPGQQFAIELLEDPIILCRNKGRWTVTVERTNNTLAVYSGAGKEALFKSLADDESELLKARENDKLAHEFLVGGASEDYLKLVQQRWRWASGGVLSIVEWRGNTWVPFFFRDIAPYGWNISLGASERDDDLSDPWTFLIREFLEETLVLADRPVPGRRIKCRPFVFERMLVRSELDRANASLQQHILQRRRKDGLNIEVGGEDDAVDVDILPTKTELVIVDGLKQVVRKNVLICVNPLELGIEVVKVVQYRLDDRDYFLDGELFDPSGLPVEIVRMPIALIKVDYLRKAFDGQINLAYDSESPPSVDVAPMESGDFHLFDFDVERRRALLTDADVTQFELERSAHWHEKFGDFFNATDGNSPRPCSKFTPASAKILSYYFANQKED